MITLKKMFNKNWIPTQLQILTAPNSLGLLHTDYLQQTEVNQACPNKKDMTQAKTENTKGESLWKCEFLLSTEQVKDYQTTKQQKCHLFKSITFVKRKYLELEKKVVKAKRSNCVKKAVHETTSFMHFPFRRVLLDKLRYPNLPDSKSHTLATGLKTTTVTRLPGWLDLASGIQVI